MTQEFSRGSRLAMRLVLVAMAVAVAATAAATGAAGATNGPPKACKQAGISLKMVKKVFGSNAKIPPKAEVQSSGVCAIESGKDTNLAPGYCGGPTCLITDVVPGRASYYKQWLANELYYLNTYGHAHKTKFHGAGSSALLLTSTKGYSGTAQPMVLFKAGSHSIEIEGAYAGRGEPSHVYKLWERFAHAIHAHLAK